ncbi:hypothetical protein R6Q59_003922 [Mikania micrantha]
MISGSDSGCRTNGDDVSAGEIMLFGVRVKVDLMRKSVSMNDLSQYVVAARDSSSNTNNLAVIAGDSGYHSSPISLPAQMVVIHDGVGDGGGCQTPQPVVAGGDGGGLGWKP